MNLNLKSIIYFLGYVISSIIALYYMPKIVSSVWLTVVLIVYWFSKDEPFWLVFFLVLTDGFMSFFGLGEANISLIPGAPGIEVTQLFILLSILKNRFKEPGYHLFFKKYIIMIGIYIIILIIIGLSFGIGDNIKLFYRIIKTTLPFLLFLSIPKILKEKKDFDRFFAFIFPIAILAFFAQLFKVYYQESIQIALGATEIAPDEVNDEDLMRTLYNIGITLLAMFGSLYYTAQEDHGFNHVYLYFVTIIGLLISFFSATRGWVLGFILALILSLILNFKIKIGRLIPFLGVLIILIVIFIKIPRINHQLSLAFERILTVEKLAEGDITADDTNVRTTIRSPAILKEWRDSPILGFGFSAHYFTKSDPHVGNENIMFHSGLIGIVLLYGFFIYFLIKIIDVSITTNNKSLLRFVAFFIGWFLIHSTSGQQFGYLTCPPFFIGQAVFFCFGAYLLEESKKQFY